MDKRRRAELLEQIEHVKVSVNDRREGHLSVIEGVLLLAEVTASIVRELGPSAHADAVSDIILPRRHDGQ